MACAVLLFASVGKIVGRLKVAGPGECFDNTKLNGVLAVERLTLVIYA